MEQLDPVSQYIEAAATLRDLIRQAHEASKDLKATINEFKRAREIFPEAVGAHLDASVRAGLEAFSESLEQAIEITKEDIFKKFDKISNIILGEEDKMKGGLNLEEQITAMINALSPVERRILAAKARKILGEAKLAGP